MQRGTARLDGGDRRLPERGWDLSQAPVKQITTGTLCHLEAAMIGKALEDWNLEELDFLFIENVGNLVCPSS